MFLLIMTMSRLSNVNFIVSAMQVYVHMGPQFMLKLCWYQGKFIQFLYSQITYCPLKEMTMPRLKLLGNLILARLMNSVKIAIEKDVQIDKIYYWTDSKVCLSWINSEKSFNVFVDNRVEEIKRLSNKLSWCYFESENNPSDLLTKMGFPLSQLKKIKIWWEGPNFLKKKKKTKKKTILNYIL